MQKKLIIVFCAVIAASAVAAGIVFFQEPPVPDPVKIPVKVTVAPSPNLTIVAAPEQGEIGIPPGFEIPEAVVVEMPETPNLAEGKPFDSGAVTDVYIAQNALDGDPLTYWESAGYPAEFTIDLADTYAVKTVAIRLNPAEVWSAREQTFEIFGSTDGMTFDSVVPETVYAFDPATGNAVRVDFPAAEARYVRLVFSANTGAVGAQAGEILIFG